jgi:hypothetical protein
MMPSGPGVPKPRTENHPGRQVSKERWIPNYDPYEEEHEPSSEPDFEAIMERRAERRRPDWA